MLLKSRLLGGPQTTYNCGKSGKLRECGRDKFTEGGFGMADCNTGEGRVSTGILMNTIYMWWPWSCEGECV